MVRPILGGTVASDHRPCMPTASAHVSAPVPDWRQRHFRALPRLDCQRHFEMRNAFDVSKALCNGDLTVLGFGSRVRLTSQGLEWPKALATPVCPVLVHS